VTFTVKVRGDTTGERYAAYTCPEHGAFDARVSRAAVPDTQPCPSCGVTSRWTIGAPHLKTTWGAAGSTMRSGERPPNTLDTRPLAEGMKKTEWDAMHAKKRRERQWKRRKDRA
jgi:hypothetical protein